MDQVLDDRIARIRTRLLAEPQPPGDLTRLHSPVAARLGGPSVATPAAVLIGLVQRGDAISVLYTERSAGLRRHSGQVAFPGGKSDDTDVNVAHTALREAEEEVALDPSDAEVIGYMPNFFTHSNFLITPVVAAITPRRPFVPNPFEVASVFELPLTMIADAGSYEPEILGEPERRFETWRIGHSGPTIWGLTAHLTRVFRDTALLEGEQW